MIQTVQYRMQLKTTNRSTSEQNLSDKNPLNSNFEAGLVFNNSQ